MRADPPFDVDQFLARPLVARLATSGPTIRPLWFLWEDGAFWFITGDWSVLRDHIARDPAVAVVVDTCDLQTGRVRQVRATGNATVEPFDRDRALRKLRRYLPGDPETWDRRRFDPDGWSDDAAFVRLRPAQLVAKDLSYDVGG